MNTFFRFIASPAGRGIRAIGGGVLIGVGLGAVRGVPGWVLAIVGLVPLSAGLLDKCVFAPLFGLPFAGPSLRRAAQ
jgi:hypothetical protein